jgi:hypothetical protein
MDESSHQPGQIVTPQPNETPDPAAPGAPQPDRPTEEPETVPGPVSEPEPTAEASSKPAAEPAADWQFHAEDTAAPLPAPNRGEDIIWTASEFISHEKSPGWYGLLALATVAAAVAMYFLTAHNVFSTVVTVLVGVIFGVFAAQKPKTQQYSLSTVGLHIGDKTYHYEDFKSFSLADEGAVISVVFMPLKRFMPPLTIYLAPDIEDRAVEYLSQIMPLEKHRRDAVDGLLKRIRF